MKTKKEFLGYCGLYCGDSCRENLKAIKKVGIDNWVKKGKKLWFGSDIDD